MSTKLFSGKRPSFVQEKITVIAKSMVCATYTATNKGDVVSYTHYRRTRLYLKVGLGMAGTAGGRTPAQCDAYASETLFDIAIRH